MTGKFILVAGNIGAGKTSLTQRLGENLGWDTSYESVQDNPYLSDFYGDMAKWAFHLQVFFLGHRAEQHLKLSRSEKTSIADRSIYEDAFIFARVLNHLGNMNERDLASYRTIFDQIVSGLPRPDLLLYLQTSVDVVYDRIQQRGREMESGITKDYLALLNRFYAEWIEEFDICPVLVIPSDDLNFVHRPDHLGIVIDKINEKLSGKENVIFPSNIP